MGLGEEVMRLAFQSTPADEWANWLRAPLLGAVAQGKRSVVLALLKAGANSVLEDRSPDHTMMHAAAQGGNAEIAKALLDHSTEHDVSAGTRATPLHVAAERGHAGVARVLLEAGARTDDDAWYDSPLSLACDGGHHEVAADLIRHGADVNAWRHGYTPLFWAALHGHLETTKVLMRASADPEYRAAEGWKTALTAAASRGHVRVVRHMVADGANVNARCGIPRVGGHNTAKHPGWTTLHRSMNHYAGAAVVRALVDLGADVNALADDDYVPLHMAAESNFAPGVNLLAEAGADIEARSAQEKTPLHVACRAASCDVVDALLRLGADTAAADREGNTPRDLVSSFSGRADRLYDLLQRARGWYQRGWVVMLRARRQRARVGRGGEAHAPPTGQGETAAAGEGRGARRDEADGLLKKKRKRKRRRALGAKGKTASWRRSGPARPLRGSCRCCWACKTTFLGPLSFSSEV